MAYRLTFAPRFKKHYKELAEQVKTMDAKLRPILARLAVA